MSLTKLQAFVVAFLSVTSLLTSAGVIAGQEKDPDKDQQENKGRAVEPLVISTNSNLEVKLSGRVHRMIQVVEDGRETDVFFTDSLQGPTMLRVDVTGWPTESFTIGGALELGLQQNSPLLVSQDRPDAGFNVSGRAAEITFDHTKVGKFSLGRGFAAAWVSAEIDLSGTQFGSLLSVGMLFSGLKFVNSDNNQLSDVRVGSHFADLERLLIADRFRYDSPRFAGLQLSGSIAADKRWDLALRTRHKPGKFTVYGATTYQNRPFRDLNWRWDGGVSARHEPTGLNATAGGTRERHNDGRYSHSFIIKLGWLARFFAIGKTAFSADITRNIDVVIPDDYARSYGAFVLQNWDKIGVHFYAGIRLYDVDRPDVSLKPITVVPFGALIRF